MALYSTSLAFKVFTICILFIKFSNATPSTSRRFIMPIFKDNNKLSTAFYLGKSQSRVDLALDLGTPFTWLSFGEQSSNSYHPIPCESPKCRAYGGGDSRFAKCSNKNSLCSAKAYNPWAHIQQTSDLIEDEIFLYSGNTSTSYGYYSEYAVPNLPFARATKTLVKSLPKGTQGVLALGPTPGALHSHISKTFNLPHKFALCINPGTNNFGFNGAMFFGGGPYYVDRDYPQDFSKKLITTPLLVNPSTTSHDYFINVQSIRVDETLARFNYSLLSLDKSHGVGGTTLSLSTPYTTLHTQIYKALSNVFVTKAASMNITKVASVPPFGACFKSSTITGVDKWGNAKVPIIDFILEGKSPLLKNKNARWRVYEQNSMVQVSDEVSCLGFVDGGAKPRASIVVGGKQMENIFVEFDLESSRLGINYDTVHRREICAQFYLSIPR